MKRLPLVFLVLLLLVVMMFIFIPMRERSVMLAEYSKNGYVTLSWEHDERYMTRIFHIPDELVMRNPERYSLKIESGGKKENIKNWHHRDVVEEYEKRLKSATIHDLPMEGHQFIIAYRSSSELPWEISEEAVIEYPTHYEDLDGNGFVDERDMLMFIDKSEFDVNNDRVPDEKDREILRERFFSGRNQSRETPD